MQQRDFYEILKVFISWIQKLFYYNIALEVCKSLEVVAWVPLPFQLGLSLRDDWSSPSETKIVLSKEYLVNVISWRKLQKTVTFCKNLSPASLLVLNDRKKTMEKVDTMMEGGAITKVISVDIWWSLIYLWNTAFCQKSRVNASSKYQKTGANLCLSGLSLHRFKSLL